MRICTCVFGSQLSFKNKTVFALQYEWYVRHYQWADWQGFPPVQTTACIFPSEWLSNLASTAVSSQCCGDIGTFTEILSQASESREDELVCRPWRGVSKSGDGETRSLLDAGLWWSPEKQNSSKIPERLFYVHWESVLLVFKVFPVYFYFDIVFLIQQIGHVRKSRFHPFFEPMIQQLYMPTHFHFSSLKRIQKQSSILWSQSSSTEI